MAKIVYREARGLDLVNIYRLVIDQYRDLEQPYPLVNEIKTMAFLAQVLGTGRIWVATVSGRLIGVLVCAIVNPQWSDLWLLHNEFFVVESHFRRHGVAQNLIKMAKDFATKRKLPIWFDMTTGGSKAEKLDRFVAFQGMGYMGGKFLFWPEGLPKGFEQ